MKARVMVMALLLLSTAVVSPAAASTPEDGDGFAGDPCGRDVIQITVDVLSGKFDKSTQCRIDTILNGSKEQEMQDIHAESNTLSASVDSYLDGKHNALENSRTVAWTKAEVATLKALENNSTQSETRVAARNAVRDYYSRMEKNLIVHGSVVVEEVVYLVEVEANQSLNSETIQLSVENQDDSRHTIGGGTFNWEGDKKVTETYTLSNGSTVNYTAFHVDEVGLIQGMHPVTPMDSGNHDLRIKSTYNGSTVYVYNSTRGSATLADIHNQRDQLLSQMNETVNGLYGSYVRGELNVTEYRSVQAAADGWATDLDENGYSIYSVLALARAGQATPDLNNTGSMTIETSEFTGNNTTEELTGLLLASEPPNGDNWTVGQTYDPANINGTLTFHVEASNRSEVLTEPFTLVGATGKDGQNISVVQTQQYNYETSNYSDLGDKLDKLIELRKEEQERIDDATNGGTGGGGWIDGPLFGGSSPVAGAAVLVVVGGVAALLLVRT
ncbi:hypothetical protein [Haloarchaeobius sp. TZWSO28]|uniref:hypothetical protein n=1 Tax=Haloarchaeobius sp. TZWSO28 TaxID=3446119 RepID=UPI003EC1352A